MTDNDESHDKFENNDTHNERVLTGSSKKKPSSRLVLLQGIRRLAMPSRSFSEGTQNVSVGLKRAIDYFCRVDILH